MSFAFLPLYVGDYLKDTQHLTPQKHGVYLKLLMHCWSIQGPVPLDEQEAAGIANCRSADEIDSLRYVLRRYFVHMEDGWYQKRMQREIEKAEALSDKLSEAGRRGYEAKAKSMKKKKIQAKAKPGLSQGSALASTPTLTLTPTTTTTTTPKEKKKDARTVPAVTIEALVADGLTEKTANEWLAHRRRKRATLTPLAWEGTKAEAAKAQWTLEEAVRKCLARGWTGFEAKWVERERQSNRHSAIGEHMAEVAQDWLNSKDGK